MYAPLHSYWNTGINLIHIDLRTLDQKIESIDRQIKFFKYENSFNKCDIVFVKFSFAWMEF